ncbi:hypothetical protein [Erwinia sp. S38]|nr:hypothetical protein [Erwinia sp. S38]MBK0000288.1 hypothetical protein [Erwinia sp. S38]
MKKLVKDNKFQRMCACLGAMVAVGGDHGAGLLLVAIAMGFSLVITHTR